MVTYSAPHYRCRDVVFWPSHSPKTALTIGLHKPLWSTLSSSATSECAAHNSHNSQKRTTESLKDLYHFEKSGKIPSRMFTPESKRNKKLVGFLHLANPFVYCYKESDPPCKYKFDSKQTIGGFFRTQLLDIPRGVRHGMFILGLCQRRANSNTAHLRGWVGVFHPQAHLVK